MHTETLNIPVNQGRAEGLFPATQVFKTIGFRSNMLKHFGKFGYFSFLQSFQFNHIDQLRMTHKAKAVDNRLDCGHI